MGAMLHLLRKLLESSVSDLSEARSLVFFFYLVRSNGNDTQNDLCQSLRDGTVIPVYDPCLFIKGQVKTLLAKTFIIRIF